MFPHGGPGVGLLFLRLAAAIVVINPLVSPSGSTSSHWAMALMLVLAISFVLGGMTPITSAIGFVLQVSGLINPAKNVDAAPVVVFALAFLALLLLGPGAYSVDGYLFGRRVLVRPDEVK